MRRTLLATSLAVAACGDEVTSAAESTSSSTTEPDASTSSIDPTAADVSGDTSSSSSSSSSHTSSTETSSSGDESSTGGGDGLSDAEIMQIHDAVDATLGQGLATGYSIAIWRGGEVIYAEGFGTKDEDGNPVTTDTLFQIGSDTKKMTAIAVLQRVDAGELTLDENVGALLGLDLVQSPGHTADLTVEDMLSHRSGMFDYTPWVDGPADSVLADVVNGSFAQNEIAMMPPGIAFNYCNPGYSLAGRVTEVLTSRAWADVVIDDIAVPLGMTQTWARRDDAIANSDDIASGVGPIFPNGIDSFDLLELFAITPMPPDWVVPAAQDDHGFTRPAGLVWSTASDMARLGGFVIQGDEAVLSSESFALLRTPVAPMYPGVDPADLGYGNGLMTLRGFNAYGGYYDVPFVTHGGNTLTMSSAFALLPEQDVAVSILANGYSEDTTPVLATALEVAAADALPEASTPTPLLDPPRDDLSVYSGTFEEYALGEVTLAFEGGDVLIDIPALTMLGIDVDPVLVAAAEDVFLLDLSGSMIELSFYDGELPFEYGVSRNFVLHRVTESMPTPPPDPALVHAWVARVTADRPLALPRLLR